jgi:hypothetical protein
LAALFSLIGRPARSAWAVRWPCAARGFRATATTFDVFWWLEVTNLDVFGFFFLCHCILLSYFGLIVCSFSRRLAGFVNREGFVICLLLAALFSLIARPARSAWAVRWPCAARGFPATTTFDVFWWLEVTNLDVFGFFFLCHFILLSYFGLLFVPFPGD